MNRALRMKAVPAVVAPAPTEENTVSFQHQWIIIGILLVSVLFNSFLAFVNANVTALNSAPVVACELLLTIAALAVALQRVDPMKVRWVVMVGFLVFFQAFTAITNASPDPKFLRDVLIIPVFILLGLSSDRKTLLRALILLQVIVLVVTIFEGLSPDGYAKVFGVKSYYINTRGFKAEAFWSKGSELFVSATRSGDRFLMAFLHIHRLSSVFLEPVSLGNYCVVAWMIILALWSQMNLVTRAFMAASTFVILVGSDGRFATVTIVVMTGLRVVVPFLPRFLNWLYLPIILVAAAAVSGLLGWTAVGDNFPSRVAFTLDILYQLDASQIFGGDSSMAYRSADSGISYLLLSQSFLGLLVIWTFVTVLLPQNDRPSLFYAHAVAIYLALNLLISYSLFSIKTASLLWFAYGAIVAVSSQTASVGPAPKRVQRFAASGRPVMMGAE